VTVTGQPITHEEFLRDAREFLEAHAERRTVTSSEWGVGSDEVPVLDSPGLEEELRDLAAAKAWRAELFDAGFAWIDGPEEYGGRGLPASFAREFALLQAGFKTPRLDTMLVSLRIVVPALAVHGSDSQKREYLPQLVRGDLVACQLFSEPEAGSDLANVRTRAVRRGEMWTVDGQKVWTSGGHYCDVGLLLTRTKPDARKHAALTMFLVDMSSEGIDVRPLRQMTGSANFNEVFIAGLQISDGARVGEVDGGWPVAVTTLMSERQAVGDSLEAPVAQVAERLVDLARHCREESASPYAAARDAIAQTYVLARVAELTGERLVAEAIRRGQVGPEMSIVKLMRQQVLSQAMDSAGALLGPAMFADTGDWGTYAWGEAAVAAPGLRIGGGTDEIQRNILAERVLGLPREPAVP
jgi:acyl-CoA dehydrogenase